MNPKRLYRNTDNKVLAGVCSGLADYIEVDVVLVRIGAVVFGLTVGTGILIYILAIFIIPPKPTINKA